jgi:uncharacterized MnhB-related membrane protein
MKRRPFWANYHMFFRLKWFISVKIGWSEILSEVAMIVHILVVAGILVCGVQAVRAPRLLLSALWLAGTSALVALEMYLLGAPEVAVIELSVGAGLVTVLFVFAINIAGEEVIAAVPVVPRPLALVLVLVSVILLAWMDLDILGMQVNIFAPRYFKTVMWDNRLLDVLLQIVLIFCGVLGVLGLLAEIHPSAARQDTARARGQ